MADLVEDGVPDRSGRHLHVADFARPGLPDSQLPTCVGSEQEHVPLPLAKLERQHQAVLLV
jgi:hypothetical protein